MGYCTRYSLTWTRTDEERATAIGDAIENHGSFSWALNRYGESGDSCKWDDHEADMKTLSLEFPGVLFTLSGEGEESGDIWKKYFRDGKMQVCKVVLDFPPFNAKLLK